MRNLHRVLARTTASAIIVAAAVLTGTIAAAHADASMPSARVVPVSGPSHGIQRSFTTQAVHAGLNAAQAATLQNQVDAYLAKEGGTQVAANEIRLPGGADLLVALPGEKRARHIDGTPNASAPCPGPTQGVGFLCAYSAQNFEGNLLTARECGFPGRVDIPFSASGSWIYTFENNQRGSFWDDAGIVGATQNSPSAGASIDWNRIVFMVACGL
jgi:hypothetical protein